MSRSLDAILGELGSTYQPQIDSIQQRQADIPGQVAAETQGLQAQQASAFDDITNGARRRGLGFSGIPLSEQAKYTSTEFLPALARLKQGGRDQAMSLEDALNGVYERRQNAAQGIYQNETAADEQRRQFDANLAVSRQAAANARPTVTPPTDPNAKTLSGGKSLYDATNALQQLLQTGNTGVIQSTIKAIQGNASRGNTYDQAKLQIINSRPEFQQFVWGQPAQAGAPARMAGNAGGGGGGF